MNFTVDSKIKLAHPRDRMPIMATIRSGYQTKDDGVHWALQRSAMIKAHYTAEDHRESAEFNAAPLLNSGDIIQIDGKPFKVRIMGDYMDCAMFDPA